MFRLFRKPRRKATRPQKHAPRFRFEGLESRLCPTGYGPYIESMSAITAVGHDVRVSGQVQDPYPGVQVAISGVVSGNVTADSSGNFSFTAYASTLGNVSAIATDAQGNSSTSRVSPVQDPTPQVVGLSIMATNVGKGVTVTGKVECADPGGLTVTFGGQVGLAQTSVTTDSEGNFSVSTTATQLGTLTAYVTDEWGEQSPTVTAMLAVAAPQIQNFHGVNDGQNYWLMSGTVISPDAADCTVTLSGVSTGSATPDGSGAFSKLINVGADPSTLEEYAVATDIWGQTSQQAIFVFP